MSEGPAMRQFLTPHERRCRFLTTLAELLGCKEQMGHVLPDGTRPDVIRLDSRRNVLFVGDAKDSESPGTTDTIRRLLNYVRWLKTFAACHGGTSILAVCFGNRADTWGWHSALDLLAAEVGFSSIQFGSKCVGPGYVVAWLTQNAR